MKRTRISGMSEKRSNLRYGDYVAMRLAISRRCEVAERIRTTDPLWLGCTHRAQGLHHLRKRSAGGRVKSRLNTLRSCNACNGWVEDHDALATLAGLVIREGHPMWPWLGVRLPSGRTL